MPSKDYEFYLKLDQGELISIIEKKDKDINKLNKHLDEIKKIKDEYYSFNKFHMEEIARLDKIIGKYKKLNITI